MVFLHRINSGGGQTFGVPHVPEVVGALSLVLFQVPRPDVVGPVDLPDHSGGHHHGFHFSEGELQADHVQLSLSL